MGRLPKLEKLKGTRLANNRQVFVRKASQESIDIVRSVCRRYAIHHNLIKACEECNISRTTFYYHIKTYEECKKIANRVGIGIRNDPEIDIVNAKKQFKEPTTEEKAAFEKLRESDELKKFHCDKKDAAISKIKSVMAIGVALECAVKFSGVPLSLFKQWMEADPELYTSLMESEARFSVFAHKEAARATTTAADKGKLAEIIMLLERRFPAQWGKIDSIDITTRNEHDQKRTMTIKADETRMIENDIIIEEIAR